MALGVLAEPAAAVVDPMPSPTTADLRAVWGSGPEDVFAVGLDGTILHYDGSAWSAMDTPFSSSQSPPSLYAVWGSGPNDV
jgi:hypothetical protein